MRVLQINAVSGIRSTGRICTEIADYLNNNGHECFISYSNGIGYYKGNIIGNKFDVKIHGLSSRVFGKQAYFSKCATLNLLRYISSLKPDIVHLHNLHGNYINLKMLLKYLAVNDIPTVITLHDCWFFTGKCTHYTVDNCYKWQTGCSNCPRLKKDNPSWFFDRTPQMYRDKKEWLQAIPRLAVIGVSDWITNEARKSFLSNAKVLKRIYNWIDLDVFKPEDASDLRRMLNLNNKFVILGVASSWSRSKGLDQFVELAGVLNSEIKIILVGNLNGNAKLPENIIHIPETHNTMELVKYYSMADVYVHLSKEETFGKTIAEAMSCGTPVVVLDATACSELVSDGCGRIVNSFSVSDVYKNILQVIYNKSEYSDLCINNAKSLFAPNLNIKLTVDLYNKLSKL